MVGGKAAALYPAQRSPRAASLPLPAICGGHLARGGLSCVRRLHHDCCLRRCLTIYRLRLRQNSVPPNPSSSQRAVGSGLEGIAKPLRPPLPPIFGVQRSDAWHGFSDRTGG